MGAFGRVANARDGPPADLMIKHELRPALGVTFHKKAADQCSSHAVSLERRRLWDQNGGPAPAGFSPSAKN